MSEAATMLAIAFVGVIGFLFGTLYEIRRNIRWLKSLNDEEFRNAIEVAKRQP